MKKYINVFISSTVYSLNVYENDPFTENFVNQP